MKRRSATLFTAALFSVFGAAACGGGVQDAVEKRAQEELEKKRQQVEERVQEEQKKVEKKVQEGQKEVEKKVQEERKKVEEGQ